MRLTEYYRDEMPRYSNRRRVVIMIMETIRYIVRVRAEKAIDKRRVSDIGWYHGCIALQSPLQEAMVILSGIGPCAGGMVWKGF